MFVGDLINCLIKYELTIHSPTFIGGAPRPLYKRKSASAPKGRGDDYQLSIKEKDHSDIELSIYYPLEGRWEFFIPATSIRGVLRHYSLSILSKIVKGSENTTGLREGEEEIWKSLPELLFGTTAQKSLLSFSHAASLGECNRKAKYSDLDLDDEDNTPERNVNLRLITQNKLDRMTMGTTEGLRTLGTIDKDNKFEGKILLKNFPWWAFGLLGMGIRGLNSHQARIGAKKGIGFGKVKIEIKDILLEYHSKIKIEQNEENVVLPGIGIISPELVWAHDRDRNLLFSIDKEDKIALEKNYVKEVPSEKVFKRKPIQITDPQIVFGKSALRLKDKLL